MFSSAELDALCILCRGIAKPQHIAWAWVTLLNEEDGRIYQPHEHRYFPILCAQEWIVKLNLPVRDRASRFKGFRTSIETRDNYDHYVLISSVKEAVNREKLRWPDRSIRRFVKAIKANKIQT
jgi:hypothetical protein